MERSELAHRRKAAIEYLGQAIFIDREHGARVAARMLAATPMPRSAGSTADRFAQCRDQRATISKPLKRLQLK